MGEFQYGFQGHFQKLNASAASSNLVVTAVTGHRIKVVNVVAVASGTVLTTWMSNTTALTGEIPLIANTGYAPPEANYGHFATASGEALYLKLSAAIPVQGWIVYQLA